MIDLRSWPLPDTWIGSWSARGFRRKRLDRQWSRYVDRFGKVPRPLSYIRSGFDELLRWEKGETGAPPPPSENAQRGANLPPPSSPLEKEGGLHVAESTDALARKFEIDVGQMAKRFVCSGQAEREGVNASAAFDALVRAAVVSKQRASLPMWKLRELDAKRAAGAAA
jgi:hypothetical protein